VLRVLASVLDSEVIVVAPSEIFPAESEAEYGPVSDELLETGGDAAVFDGPLVEPPKIVDELRPVPTAEEVGAIDATPCELDVGLLFTELPVRIKPVDDALDEVVGLPRAGDTAVTPVACGFDGELDLVDPTGGDVYVPV